jgi:uncharacterized protein DUF1549
LAFVPVVWLAISLPIGASAKGLAADTTARPAAASFELDVVPVLTAAGCNAGACHGKSRGQNGFQLSLLGFDPEFDYAALTREARGRRVFPAAPERSLILQKATAAVPHGGGQRLTVDQPSYEVLRRWIAAGVPRHLPHEPGLQSLVVASSGGPFPLHSRRQLIVTACYSDGSTRDVTSLSAYQSNQPAVAAVSDTGLVTAGSIAGEATIMARYAGQIATSSVLIPREERLPSDDYAALPRLNFIDPLVWHKLEDVGYAPSPPASDSTLLRRAYLDILGRLPSVDEARAFLTDESSEKRTRLIATLVERPEFADHWANLWADLLRPNPYRVGIKATRVFDAWLRDSFRRTCRTTSLCASCSRPREARGATARRCCTAIDARPKKSRRW